MAKDKWENWFKRLLIGLAVAALLLAVGAVAVAILLVKDQSDAAMAMSRLKVVLSYEILILTFFYGLMVLLYMAAGEIDLTMLLCEPKGNDKDGNPIYGASMSRFQLLIFTFVIALSLLLITIANGAKQFPAVPSEILVLLGISASTYAVGKGIQSGSSAAATGADVAAPPHPTAPTQPTAPTHPTAPTRPAAPTPPAAPMPSAAPAGAAPPQQDTNK